MKTPSVLSIAIGILGCLWSNSSAALGADRPPPKYVAAENLAGKLEIYGNESLDGLITLLIIEFHRIYPHIDIRVEPILNGTSLFAEGPREVDNPVYMIDGDLIPQDATKLKALAGPAPMEVSFCLQAAYVLVHKTCPLDEISIETLRELYYGDSEKQFTWSDLGVSSKDWAPRPVSINGLAGHYGVTRLLKQKVGAKGLQHARVIRRTENLVLRQTILADPYALGYAAGPFPGLKVLSVRPSIKDAPAVKPPMGTAGPIYGSAYPLARLGKLHSAQGAENRVHHEFLKFALSESGLSALKEYPFAILLDEADYEKERLRLIVK